MIKVRQTAAFAGWLMRLKNSRAKQKIAVRVRRLAFGNPGDVRPVGQGISELRIPEGPGYRVYYVQKGDVLIVLLCGGDKSSQSRDIAKAKELAQDLEDEE